jgi:hypothetical protein
MTTFRNKEPRRTPRAQREESKNFSVCSQTSFVARLQPCYLTLVFFVPFVVILLSRTETHC